MSPFLCDLNINVKLLVEHLSDKYYICSYRDFCLGPRANDIYVGQQIQKVRDAIDTRNIVFTDWEHQRVLRYDSGYNFVGFKAILGENYQTNKWAVSVPTFGHKDFGEHQFSNLDMLIYVNSFNKDYDVAKIDHSNKPKDFLFLPGKPREFRVYLLKELLSENLLERSVWSASSGFNWNTFEKLLPLKYEIPKWHGKKVIGFDDTTRQVHHLMYNDTSCSIVAETLIDNDCHYITEKTCKPLMAEHVFVILSGMGFLKNLRDLGFKTFHDYIDESYDQCANLTDRVNGIIKTCKQIKSMDKKKLYEDTVTIRRHNRELFFSKEFYNKFNDRHMELLANYFQK